MKHTWCALAAASVLVSGAAIAALDAGNQYKLDQITQGGPASLRSAAQSIANTGADPVVLDALAEAALKNKNDGTGTGVDAVAWSCKALAAAGGKRYYNVIKSLADNDGTHRKARKHCERAAGDVGGPDDAQYVAGSTSLDKVAAKAGNSAKQTAPAAASSGQFKPLSEIKVGMSMEEAYAIAGPPTATSGHITGKAFNPFNFKGGDSYRTYGLYKGQGRLVFANNSAYSSGQRVVEVIINADESGYP
jgi:hypothetical protein